MNEIGREFSDGQVVPGTRYRVLRLIGVGGMGSVYDVEHVELGKRFVLKSLLRELARRQELVARLRQEWRALARLEHPNIVNVTDAGTSEGGVPFYVMERLDGETLGARIARERRLSVETAVEIAAGVLEGLSAAHAIGIVHRDVKPPNIFVLNGGGVKLLDFGIAKIASSSAEVITARGLAIGTPRYMSPEQARGERVDGRADLYAVGLLLFEMIAGAGPFDDTKDANDLLLAQLTRPAARLSSVAQGVAPEIDAIVAVLLEKDPRQRPSSARVVARALRQALGRAGDAPADAGGAESLTRASDPPTELPGTRRDGVAAREAFAPSGDDPARTTDVQAMNAKTTLRLDAPTMAEPGSSPTLHAGATDAASPLAGATEQHPALAVADTLFDPSSSGASAPRSDRTLTLEELGDAPRAMPEPAATRTALPVVEHAGETPPPVESGAAPAAGVGRQLPKRAVLFGGAAFVISAALIGAWVMYGGRSADTATSDVGASQQPATLEPAASPAPSARVAPTAAASARPSAAPPLVAASARPSAARAKPAPAPPETSTSHISAAAAAPSSAVRPAQHAARTQPRATTRPEAAKQTRSGKASLPSSGL